ncbi:Peptidase M23 [Pseudanabaena biceps PCC 7429]|uniref:Peptidase M23 n=1 Tax=Pseudanabaena biceps PCC 7429 TaxID=927668 RepID=L8MZ62_9CYAN|nr:Peptidase M23 [Pseudanabaena biceps PCC 7429]
MEFKNIMDKKLIGKIFLLGTSFSVLSYFVTSETYANVMPFSGSTRVTQTAHADGYGLRAIDLGLGAGTPVLAPANVTVIATCNAGNNHRAIKLKADDGTFYSLIHVYSTNIQKGQRFQQGERIGTVASDKPWNKCAKSTGIHLHFGSSSPVVDNVNIRSVRLNTVIQSSN